MPCVRFKNAIICLPNIRKFRYKNKYYFVESGGWGCGISDQVGNEINPDDCKNRMRSKLYKEMTKGV